MVSLNGTFTRRPADVRHSTYPRAAHSANASRIGPNSTFIGAAFSSPKYMAKIKAFLDDCGHLETNSEMNESHSLNERIVIPGPFFSTGTPSMEMLMMRGRPARTSRSRSAYPRASKSRAGRPSGTAVKASPSVTNGTSLSAAASRSLRTRPRALEDGSSTER